MSTDLKPYGDYLYREMNDEEFNAVQQYLLERDKNDGVDYLAQHQLGRDNAWSFQRNGEDEQVVFVKSTSLLPVGEDDVPEPGLPPGVGEVTLEPVLLRVKNGEVIRDQKSAEIAIAVDGHEDIGPPAKVSSKTSSLEEWKKAEDFTKLGIIKQNLSLASLREDIAAEAAWRETLYKDAYKEVDPELTITTRALDRDEIYSVESAYRKSNKREDEFYLNPVGRMYKTEDGTQVAVVSVESADQDAEGRPTQIDSYAVIMERGLSYEERNGKTPLGALGIDSKHWESKYRNTHESKTMNYGMLKRQETAEGVAQIVKQSKAFKNKKFLEQVEGDSFNPRADDGYSFRELGDEHARFRVRMATKADIITIEQTRKETYDNEHKAKNPDIEDLDQQQSYIIHDKISGHQFFVGIETTSYSKYIKNKDGEMEHDFVVERTPVVSSIGLTTKTKDNDKALDILGISEEDLPKPVSFSLADKNEVMNAINDKFVEEMSLANIKKLVNESQLEKAASYELPEHLKPQAKNARREAAGAVSFYVGLDNYKDDLARTLRNTEFADDAQKQKISSQLEMSVLSPETFVSQNGKFAQYDQRQAVEALASQKPGTFVSLQTLDGSGAIARNTVGAKDLDDSAVLSVGDTVLASVDVKKHADDKEFTRIYAVKAKGPADEYYNYILAERISQDGILAKNEEALNAVGLQGADFKRTSWGDFDSDDGWRDNRYYESRDISFVSQLSPDHLRRAMVASQLDKFAAAQKDFEASPTGLRAREGYQTDEFEVRSAIQENNGGKLAMIAQMQNNDVKARRVSINDLHLLNIAYGVHDQKKPSDGFTDAVIIDRVEHNGSVNKMFVANKMYGTGEDNAKRGFFIKSVAYNDSMQVKPSSPPLAMDPTDTFEFRLGENMTYEGYYVPEDHGMPAMALNKNGEVLYELERSPMLTDHALKAITPFVANTAKQNMVPAYRGMDDSELMQKAKQALTGEKVQSFDIPEVKIPESTLETTITNDEVANDQVAQAPKRKLR